MTDCTLESSVVDWIIEHPETMRLLEDLGIDCSCGGKSLVYVCRQAGLEPEDVLAQLHRIVNGTST